MTKLYKNKAHLAWVHDLGCCLRNAKVADALRPSCMGEIQAHHLLKPWNGSRGMAMKASDKNVIPLCFAHHQALHNRGNELEFFRLAMDDENYGKKVAEIVWLTSPYFERN
tara:strand:+ start:329 stop:661 length:333 start_codon:yes stop_codon:yes gene_type:complete